MLHCILPTPSPALRFTGQDDLELGGLDFSEGVAERIVGEEVQRTVQTDLLHTERRLVHRLVVLLGGLQDLSGMNDAQTQRVIIEWQMVLGIQRLIEICNLCDSKVSFSPQHHTCT